MTNKYTEAEKQEMLWQRAERQRWMLIDFEHDVALEEDRRREGGKALLEAASYGSRMATDLQAVKQKLHDELEAAKQARVEATRRMMELERDLQEEQARRAQDGKEFAVKMLEQKTMLDRAQVAARRLSAHNTVLKAMISAAAAVDP